MKFGIKQKILLVLIGVLALTTGLAALLASYFTNLQNEQTAFADLERDLLTWQNDLHASTIRLREVALDAVGDPVILNQLAELVTLELNLNQAAGIRESSEVARTLAYTKSVSLNRLHLVLRTGGFTSIAVYTGGKLSHYVSASEAGMMVRKAIDSPVWIQASADTQGNLPFQSWPAWTEALPRSELTSPPAHLNRPTVSFNFQSPQQTRIEIAVPVQGISEVVAIDVVAQGTTQFVSELAIAQPATNDESGRQASTVAVVVFQKLIDRAALEEVATKTGTLPALFSPDGKHRQLLTDITASAPDLWNAQAVQVGTERGVHQRTVTNRAGSFYQALLPWEFEGQPRLILGLASSRASTLQNIRQTVAAILIVAGLVLLLSISLGMFWVNRFIDPIVALTAAAKKMGMQRRLQSESAASHQASVEVLRRIAVEAPDEVGDLAKAFNAMIAELRQSFETLEQRVQGRTAELRQQTRYLRTLIDTLPLLVWLKDTHSRYLAANQASADACGRTAEDLVGKSDLDIWPREIAESYRADDADVMKTRQRKTVEEPLLDVKGTIWIETYKAPVLDEDGTVLGTVGAARDISERKAAEAAREAALAEAERLAQLRSEFLAQMSHELRTPLNAILGYAQILQRDERLTDRQARGLAIIQESGHHLLTLINDILDLSRIGASKLELYPVDVNLAAFLRTVSDIIRVKADEKSLLFTYEGSADLPSAVRVDDKRLRQVLLNLLGNAVKFTDRGHITLRAQRAPVSNHDGIPTEVGVQIAHDSKKPSAENVNGEDDADRDVHMVRLRFEVEDTGIGMTREQVERIFHPFEQVADVARRRGGAGLGLAISRQLVRLMGGDIQVRSEAGKGSVFSFELDVPVAESQPDVLPTQRAIGYAGPRRKILIVDDVPQSRAMLMDFLTTLGFDVADATNGQEAIDQAQRIRPDLIVMDIAMPVMDGLEATRRIRRSPELAQVPILIASASATSEDESRSRASGASAFVPKPIEQERLLKAIGEHLAVEWMHEEEITEEPELAPTGTTEAMIIPPQEEMDVLHRLALAGNMRDIRERANYLKDLDPRYEPFVRRLQSLAQRYQSEAILALVERYRAEAK
jgi:PAS domain S-box-containing protein